MHDDPRHRDTDPLGAVADERGRQRHHAGPVLRGDGAPRQRRGRDDPWDPFADEPVDEDESEEVDEETLFWSGYPETIDTGMQVEKDL